MNLKGYNKTIFIGILLICGLGFLSYFFNIKPSIAYDPSVWIEMSVALGAAILTLVGIFTSILTSNENKRREELVEIINKIIVRIDDKLKTIPDRSFHQHYIRYKTELNSLIELFSPLKYSKGLLGLGSFYFFLLDVILILFNYQYNVIFFGFIVGIAFLVGYLAYCMAEFVNIDKMNEVPTINGNVQLLNINVVGDDIHFNSSDGGKTFLIKTTVAFKNIIIKTHFKGKVRNGFLHATVFYNNNTVSYIPDRNTFLMDFGFINDNQLAVYAGEDTGAMQNDIDTDLSMNIKLRGEKNPTTKIGTMPFGSLYFDVYKNCTIPDIIKVTSIEIRVYEDPMYKPNYKRREVCLFTITPQYEAPPPAARFR